MEFEIVKNENNDIYDDSCTSGKILKCLCKEETTSFSSLNFITQR